MKSVLDEFIGMGPWGIFGGGFVCGAVTAALLSYWRFYFALRRKVEAFVDNAEQALSSTKRSFETLRQRIREQG